VVLDALPLSGWELTGWGIVAIVVVLLLQLVAWLLRRIFSGELVTRREVDAEKERADTWQQAWEASQAGHREKDEALIELLQLGRTSARLLEGLQQAAAGGDDKRGPA
jgi:hypothetical protein